MKYLRKFENEAAYSAYTESEDYVTPNVCLCEDEKEIRFNPYVEPHHDYSKDYLTIVSTSDNNTIEWEANEYGPQYKTISVSIDDGQTWTDKTSVIGGETLAVLNTGDKLLIKGNNNSYGGGSFGYTNYFTSSGQFNVEGNIMSMIYGDNFIGQTILPDSSAYSYLFYNCVGLVDASNLILPATTLTRNCYRDMFNGCTSLTTAPELPATTLVGECYAGMFRGCTSLTTAPVLPASEVVDWAYLGMFEDCTSLNYVKCLATDISADYAVEGWLYNVASSGTLVKDPSMTEWPTDSDSGIPKGWTVEDAPA